MIESTFEHRTRALVHGVTKSTCQARPPHQHGSSEPETTAPSNADLDGRVRKVVVPAYTPEQLHLEKATGKLYCVLKEARDRSVERLVQEQNSPLMGVLRMRAQGAAAEAR